MVTYSYMQGSELNPLHHKGIKNSRSFHLYGSTFLFLFMRSTKAPLPVGLLF